jgi:hypothetical protein
MNFYVNPEGPAWKQKPFSSLCVVLDFWIESFKFSASSEIAYAMAQIHALFYGSISPAALATSETFSYCFSLSSSITGRISLL